MNKVLIIGGSGFVGKVFVSRLQQENVTIYVTKLPMEKLSLTNVQLIDMDILDYEQICETLESVKPDIIFHLAAVSSVAFSWKDPEMTLRINVLGSLHVMEAVRQHCPKARLLLIGSSEEYGRVQERDNPIGETFRLQPENPYAASKAMQDFMGHIYASAYQLDIIRIRAFNHIGIGQLPGFAIPDFCRQIARIEAGLNEPVIRVGNLSARRDYLDVRDVVEAYWLLSQKGISQREYNVGSGKPHQVKEMLDILLSMSRVEIHVEEDPAKLRPVDVPLIVADVERLKMDTGWSPCYDIRDTLHDILNDWRSQVAHGA